MRESELTINPLSPDLSYKDPSLLIARAFIRQQYPLSTLGDRLREELGIILREGDTEKLRNIAPSLPTVEHPQLHLFKDLELSEEDRKRIFGDELANVQVTKGCSHKCDFCAAGASAKVEMMPYAAVLKISGITRELDREEEAVINYLDERRARRRQDNSQGLRVYGFSTVAEALEIFSYKDNLPQQKRRDNGFTRHYYQTNYYDSDPFDYRDASFVHEDGKPAEYGDVFSALASNLRPIYITTAGWSRHNKNAQAAMNKIIGLTEENPRKLAVARLSVNPFELRAKQNLHEYLEDTRLNIDNIAMLPKRRNPEFTRGEEILFFSDRHYDFETQVIVPLEEYIRETHPDLSFMRPEVSYFSGPMAKGYGHDVMACMGGYHIWPDGTVAQQKFTLSAESPDGKQVEDGTRPVETGLKLY